MLLEICANSLQSAINAQEGGADRIELCHDLSVGGLTPNLETLQAAKDQLTIPIYVLIRCRSGNFVYSPEELALMEEQIKQVASLGYPGVVFGCLRPDNEIEVDATQRLLRAANFMDVTFHKAFDEVPNQLEGLDCLREMGIQRILTSGGATTALEGMDILAELVDEAEDEMIIMPGGGIRPANIHELIGTGASEYHSAAMEPGTEQASVEMVKQLKSALR